MKGFANSLIIFSALTSIAGCNNSGYPYRAQKPPASAYYKPPSPIPTPTPVLQAQNNDVAIISEPARARIEVNDDYVGDAPITIKLPQQDGYFTATTTIRALPTEGGDYTQQKMFFPAMGGLRG